MIYSRWLLEQRHIVVDDSAQNLLTKDLYQASYQLSMTGNMIKWSFPFLRANFHLIFRLSDYSHENAVANDHSPSKDYANNLNALDQERDFFLNNVDDEEKVDAFDKPDVLDDLQVDSMIDENEEAEDEEFFDL